MPLHLMTIYKMTCRFDANSVNHKIALTTIFVQILIRFSTIVSVTQCVKKILLIASLLSISKLKHYSSDVKRLAVTY